MTSHGATLQVLYPQKEGSTFNLDYYKSTHLPLCVKNWTKFGLKSWHLTQLDSAAPYSFLLVVEFDNLEGLQKAAVDPSIKEMMADIPNYSSEEPILLTGPVIERTTL